MVKLVKAHKPWVYMRNHVRHFVQTYAACQKMSTIPRDINSIPYSVATYAPMVCLKIDFIGPIDNDGYILNIIDSFSKWVELFACNNCTALEAARCLLQHFGRYGDPSQILSDNGSHFVNEVISEFLQLVGNEHKLTVACSQ